MGFPGRALHILVGCDRGSQLMFVIAMEALSALFAKAMEDRVISSFNGITATQRLSIYADDVALFIKPAMNGLKVNYVKSCAIMIMGCEEDRNTVAAILQCTIGVFLCKSLGIQLGISHLTKADWQPLLDQVTNFIPAWQRGLIQRPERLILVKSMISSRPIHHLMILDAPQWVFDDINSWIR